MPHLTAPTATNSNPLNPMSPTPTSFVPAPTQTGRHRLRTAPPSPPGRTPTPIPGRHHCADPDPDHSAAYREHGAFTDREVREALGAAGLRDALDHGELVRFAPGVLIPGDRTLDLRTRCAAALRYAGPGAVLVGPTAAALHGCSVVGGFPVHLTVPTKPVPRGRNGMVIRLAAHADHEVTTVEGLRVLALPVALAGVLREAPRRAALACVDQALHLLPDEPARTALWTAIRNQLRPHFEPATSTTTSITGLANPPATAASPAAHTASAPALPDHAARTGPTGSATNPAAHITIDPSLADPAAFSARVAAHPSSAGLAGLKGSDPRLTDHTADPSLASEKASAPSLAGPTAFAPCVADPAITDPAIAGPAVAGTASAERTSAEPTSVKPTSTKPTTVKPGSAKAKSTTVEPGSDRPTIGPPTAADPAIERAVGLLHLATGQPPTPAHSSLLLTLVDAGFPRPTCQYPLRDGSGRTRVTVPFAWPELRIALTYEPDDTRTPSTTENELDRRGWWLVRARLADLTDPTPLYGRLRAAFHDRRWAA